ncbi:RnfABCDGE type electron transport complex subunit D [Bifidobacterium longum subsp. infantis]|nr:RnfABCDGE type electron transport complex subunit D [Bifidobacterium longum subsp. infantis]
MQQITPNNPVIRTMGRIDIDVPDRPYGCSPTRRPRSAAPALRWVSD